jgi:L,D-transpeptidase YbiS
MKKKRRIVFVIIIVLLAGGAVAVFRSPTAPQAPDFAAQLDTLNPVPPAEDAALQKELKKARKSLSKLQPSKPYIVIDTHANFAYLRTADSILFKATCSTGSGGELIDSLTGQKWIFDTPRGAFTVKNKLKDPWWRKPDWAFIEEDEEIPTNPNDRMDPNVMGDYALGFGDGYFIHGTLYERLLGINVSHGCVRLGADNLKYIYDRVGIGTPVYIF